jgi:hypothetical protein
MARQADGIGLGAIFAGSVLAYAGIKGYSVPHTIQLIVQGKPVTGQNQVSPIGTPSSPSPSGAAAAGESGVASAAAPSGTEKSWIGSFLTAISAPGTPANESSVSSWISHEGPFSSSDNNPLNTTLATAGSVGTKNSIGVQKYATPSDGVNATAQTLLQGNYGDIVMLLRSGQGLCGHTLSGLSTWSGGGYSSVC